MRTDYYLVTLFFLAAALFLAGCGAPDTLLSINGVSSPVSQSSGGNPASPVLPDIRVEIRSFRIQRAPESNHSGHGNCNRDNDFVRSCDNVLWSQELPLLTSDRELPAALERHARRVGWGNVCVAVVDPVSTKPAMIIPGPHLISGNYPKVIVIRGIEIALEAILSALR